MADSANGDLQVLGFYGHSQGKPYREFSNFYYHQRSYRFKLPKFAQRDGFPTEVWCSFSETAIMATKAALMGDLETFKKIEASENPAACKKLGREVKHFDEALWDLHLADIAFEVVKQKFMSDSKLKDLLLSTGEAIIAEAAPNDKIWGIGLGLSDPRVNDPSKWLGLNILGGALMKTRSFLSEQNGARHDASSPTSTTTAPSTAAATTATTATETAETVAQPPRRRWGKTPQSKEAATSQLESSASTRQQQPQQQQQQQRQQLFDVFAVLDFEATCDNEQQIEPQEVIELPIVLVDARSGIVIDKFRTYVQPVHNPQLTSFCTELTGIEQHLVDNAPTWTEALLQAQTWLDEQLAKHNVQSFIFVTCGDWDLKTMMPRQCKVSGMHVPERFQRWLNIKNFFKSATGQGARGMAQMLQSLELKLEGRHHSGLDDSCNIARILLKLLQQGGQVSVEMLSFADAASSSSKSKGSRSSKAK
eukprot:TRINITY_DN7958_c0_g2_i3.p1 TRINITY_DN7958_c0_g2~~TRINITY_DN7958_c0_g2_i3.p1  ORF type:complete len:478 (-),score=100.85 TRINITY_DN7958_c0_g2_i3:157-1590(-)